MATQVASRDARSNFDARSTVNTDADVIRLRLIGGVIGISGFSLGIIAAWFFARNLSGPINKLTEGTRKIHAGNLDLVLAVTSDDELGKLTSSFNEMALELKQKERYRELLGKVSDESVAQAMIEGTLAPTLGGELKEVTVLFCDIRGFTRLTENMRPESVIELLNQHMTVLAEVVREHGGVVDKFVGDEIMAVFGGLKCGGNKAENAARSAFQMLEKRSQLNRKTGADIQIGIGIVTGEVVAGCMGSEDRLNYTVLGANVNLGAHLCANASPGEILINESTLRELDALNPTTKECSKLNLKGSWPNTIVSVLHSLDEPRSSLKNR